MICTNCGAQNSNESRFCAKCGHNMIDNQVSMDQQSTFNQQNNNNEKISIVEYLSIILAIILKPFTTFKEEVDKFNVFKNSITLSLIISVVATVIALIKTVINTVRVTSFWSDKVEWVWDNLSKINFFQVIIQNFSMYFGIIIAIAFVYYIASMVVKKQVKFSRLLGISAVSVVPMFTGFLILSPLLSMINGLLGMAVTIIGAIYTIIMIYEIINSEILLEGNTKFYVNLICLSTLTVTAYYLYMKIVMLTASSSVDNFLKIFGN